MKILKFSIVVLIVCFTFALTTLAEAVTLSLVPSKTNVKPGEQLTVEIRVDDASDLVSCAFSLHYPQEALELAPMPVTTEFFRLAVDDRPDRPEGSPFSILPWEQNTATAGIVRLSGVYIKSSDGGPNYTGAQTLFTVHFQVKSAATTKSYNFELQQTKLCNGPAGWGTDPDNDGQCDFLDTPEGVPILVSAVPKSDEDWNDLTKAFPVLLASFSENPTADFSVASAAKAMPWTLLLLGD
jgi:hypothetical protein